MHRRILLAAGLTLAAAWAVMTNQAAESSPGQVYVVNTQDASVTLVDLTTSKEVRRFEVGPRPYGVAVSRDGRTVAVGVGDEEKIKFYDASDFKPKGEVRVGRMFNDNLALSTDVKYFLSNIGDGTLQLADVSTQGKLRSIAKAQVGKAPKRVAFVRAAAVN